MCHKQIPSHQKWFCNHQDSWCSLSLIIHVFKLISDTPLFFWQQCQPPVSVETMCSISVISARTWASLGAVMWLASQRTALKMSRCDHCIIYIHDAVIDQYILGWALITATLPSPFIGTCPASAGNFDDSGLIFLNKLVHQYQLHELNTSQAITVLIYRDLASHSHIFGVLPFLFACERLL